MNLRHKWFTIFGELGLLALSTTGVTLWSIRQWQATEQQHHSNGHPDGTITLEQTQAVTQQLDQLLHAITRMTEFGFPLDLNLTQTDIRRFLYEVLLRFHEEFVQQHVSYDLQIAPEIHTALYACSFCANGCWVGCIASDPEERVARGCSSSGCSPI